MCTQYFHSCSLAGDLCSKNIRLLSIQIDIFRYEPLIIPIHQSTHWTLIIVKVTSKEIMYFNSLGHDDDTCLHVVAYVLILDNIYPRNTNSSGSKFTNCDENGFTYEFNWAGTDSSLHNTWLQLTRVSEFTEKIRGHQLYMDNYFSSPALIRWLSHETNLRLWHCPTQQEGNATGLRPQVNDIQMGRPTGTD